MMTARCGLMVLALLLPAVVLAQVPPGRAPVNPSPEGGPAPGTVGTPRPGSPAPGAANPRESGVASPPLEPVNPTQPRPRTRVTKGTGTLPNDQGQVWREYEISDYVLGVTSTNQPEQAIVDWILRETGYEAWHSEPVALLSANRRTLRVYHTPEMQAVVGDIVDRFLAAGSQSHSFGVRIVTVENPNWRARSHPLLQPVPTQTPGVGAWLLEKESAAQLAATLEKRTDFREHSSPHLMVNNGQATTIARTHGRSYVRDIHLRPEVWPGFETELAEIDEGFNLQLSPLLSIDGAMIDAVIKLHVDQVEKFVPVILDVATQVAPRQRSQVDVPQVAQFRLKERFRWPADKVLLIDVGMVASPVPGEPKGLKLPFMGGSPRSNMLIFVESKGAAAGPATPAPRVGQAEPTRERYRNRY